MTTLEIILAITTSIFGGAGLIFGLGKSFGWFDRDQTAKHDTVERLLNEHSQQAMQSIAQTEKLLEGITEQHKSQTEAIVAPLNRVATNIEKLIFRDEEQSKRDAVKQAILEMNASK